MPSSAASRSIAGHSEAAYSCWAPLSIQSSPTGTMRAVMKQPGRIGARAAGPGVGPDAVSLVVTEAGGGDRVPGLLTDLKNSFHHLAPALQHLAVVLGEVGMLRCEDLRHGAAVSQRLLQDEMVYHVGDVGLAGDPAGGVLVKHLVELAGKAR